MTYKPMDGQTDRHEVANSYLDVFLILSSNFIEFLHKFSKGKFLHRCIIPDLVFGPCRDVQLKEIHKIVSIRYFCNHFTNVTNQCLYFWDICEISVFEPWHFETDINSYEKINRQKMFPSFRAHSMEKSW